MAIEVEAVPGRLSEEPSLVVTTHSCARCRSSRPVTWGGVGCMALRDSKQMEATFLPLSATQPNE